MKPIYLKTNYKDHFRDKISLSMMMFLDYEFIIDKLKERDDSPAVMKRIDWLLSTGEEVEAEMNCPFCESGKVKVFGWDVSKEGRFYVGPELTSCMKGRCREKLYGLLDGIKGGLREIKFSAMITLARNSAERKMIADLYKKVFNLSQNICPESSLNFFKTQGGLK